MQRRTFLKILSGAAAGLAVAPLVPTTSAPLFIPAEHLEFGVPKQQVILPTLDEVVAITAPPGRTIYGLPVKEIPMMLSQDNFIPEHGGRLKAGSVLLVDESTALRWQQYGVAMPAAPGWGEYINRGRDWGQKPTWTRKINEYDHAIPGSDWSAATLWETQHQPEYTEVSRPGHVHDIVDGEIQTATSARLVTIHEVSNDGNGKGRDLFDAATKAGVPAILIDPFSRISQGQTRP